MRRQRQRIFDPVRCTVTLGVLALLGSGEIAPSMTKVHRQLLKRLEPVRAVSLDTAYGFQANVPQMTEKIIEYFATSLRYDIKPLHFTSSKSRQKWLACHLSSGRPRRQLRVRRSWQPRVTRYTNGRRWCRRGPSRHPSSRWRPLLRLRRGTNARFAHGAGLRDLQSRSEGELATPDSTSCRLPVSAARSYRTTTTPKVATTTLGSATSAKNVSSNSNANCPTTRAYSASTNTRPASST